MDKADLTASKGKIYTNGEVYATKIYLGSGDTAENWKQITLTKYAEIMAAQEEGEE